MEACEALAEAHTAGMIHRDIKPSNLFVVMRDDKPHVKVLDFGISKVMAGMEGIALTQTQSMLGTPAYMSPEQMRSARTVDLRSDVWSIGTVLYEMIEGGLPFSAETFSEMIVKVSVDPPTPPSVMSPELAAVVLRCLEKRAEDRHATCAELARDLSAFARDPQLSAVASGSHAAHVGPARRRVWCDRVAPQAAPALMPLRRCRRRFRSRATRWDGRDVRTPVAGDRGHRAGDRASGSS